MLRLLLIFALTNLVLGTGAFVLGGILGPISESLGISVQAAGQAVTAYAVSTALLAPLMLVLTGKWMRKRAMQLALLLVALGNGVCALAPDLFTLMAGRVLMGMGAVFTPIAAGIAVATSQPGRQGRALSIVFLGISLSYVVGVPLGAWLGFRYGWQVPLALVGAGALLMLIVVSLGVPQDIDAPGGSLKGLPAALKQGAVVWPLALTFLYFTAIFCVFAYIGPVLQALLPMSSERLSLTLMLFGLSGVIGTLVGGWANDRFGPRRTLTVQLTTLGSMMVLVPFTQGSYAAIVTVFVIWGIGGFGMMTPQQSRLVSAAPTQAPVLLSLNTSMLYMGTALGAAFGGAASTSLGFAKVAWAGVPLVVLGLATLWISRPAKRPIPAGSRA